MRNKTDANRARNKAAVAAMLKEGTSRLKIASALGLSISTVRRYVYEAKDYVHDNVLSVSAGDRRRSIKRLVLLQHTKRQIAQELHLSIASVDKYLYEIKRETGEDIRALLKKELPEDNEANNGLGNRLPIMDFKGRRFDDIKLKVR